MTLMYFFSALWKYYRGQTTIIHVVNVVHLMTSHVNIYPYRRPLQNRSLTKNFDDVDFPLCIMLESKYFFSGVNYRRKFQ